MRRATHTSVKSGTDGAHKPGIGHRAQSPLPAPARASRDQARPCRAAPVGPPVEKDLRAAAPAACDQRADIRVFLQERALGNGA